MDSEESRAEELATKSLEYFKSNRQDDAVRNLREALALAPRNPIVLAAFQFLQQDAAIPPVSKLVHKYAMNDDSISGDEALRILGDRNGSLQTSIAVDIIELLFTRIEHLPNPFIGGKMVGEALRSSRGAREHMADTLGEKTEKTFVMMERFGQEAIDGLVMVLLDPLAWKSAPKNTECLRTCFRILISRLTVTTAKIYATRTVARLLAGKPEELHSFVNQGGLEQLLGLLKPGTPQDLRLNATLAIGKFAEVSEDIAQSMISKFMVSKLAADGDDDLQLVFSVAAAIFPLVPQTAAQLFLAGGFVENLISWLQARPLEVEEAALEMLSAACIDKACRASIATHCTEYLETVVRAGFTGRSIAAVVLAKIKFGVSEPGQTSQNKDMDELADVFKGLMGKKDTESRESSVEGLAYTSLKGSVKDTLVNDKNVIKGLIDTLNSSSGKPTVMFGALTVIENLTAYLPVLSEEQKKMAQLKNYAEAKSNLVKPKVEPEDTDDRVSRRCKTLLDAGVVPALVSCGKNITPNAITIISKILLSLAKVQKHRGLIASQGGVKLALQFYSSSIVQDNPGIKQASAHALGRILVSVNPSHVFSSQLTISAAVRPLLILLNDISEQTNLLPVFEALLALTNLASTDDGTRDLIIRSGWTKIEELLLSDNPMIQRATVELICNLMAAPQGVAKYADGSKVADNRLHILLALADAEDLATRRAAGGALAMLTEWDKACEAVAKRKRGIKIILSMVTDENIEMRHRGVVVLRNLVCGETSYARKVKADGGIEILREALRETRQPEILAVGVDALKVLMTQDK